MRNLFFLALIFTLSNCIEHSDENEISSQVSIDTVSIDFAEGLEVTYEEGYVKIITQSFDQNADFRDSLYIRTNPDISLPENVKTLSSTTRSLACQSSTHLAFLNELEKLNEVVALCGMKYIQSETISAVLEKNNVRELCLEERIEKEIVYSANPDLFLLFPFERTTEENPYPGISTLLVAEYLEKDQIARLEWIKLFGLLTGATDAANAYFENTQSNYEGLSERAINQDASFIMNLPFQESWFMPSSNSVGVKMIEDAGLTYFYKAEEGTENQLHPTEEVWEDGLEADYWIIIAQRQEGFSLDDLLAEKPVYAEFKAVKENKVVFCNTATSDYFSRGIVQPDVILKDLLYATGQLEHHTPSYFFRLQ